MRMAAVLAVSLWAFAGPALAAAPSETEKLAAWARLYGVMRWFHPSDAAQQIDWNRLAVQGVRATRAAATRADLERTLRNLVAPVGVGVVIGAELPVASSHPPNAGTPLVAWRHRGFGLGANAGGGVYQSVRTHRRSTPAFDAPLRAGTHADVELGAGLRARIPLVLTDAEAAIGARAEALLHALKLGAATADDAGDGDTRLADVVVAWNVFRHFYPYWAEVGVDWDARLPGLLEAAAAAPSREAHHAVLRRLVAEVRDGHGSVTDPKPGRPLGVLPISVRRVGGRWVVTASSQPEQVQLGDAIEAIDGLASRSWFADQEALHSGSPQWRSVGAARALVYGPEGSRVTLELERAGTPLTVALTRRSAEPPRETRPEPIGEIRPGVWYVDLTRANWTGLEPRLAKLAQAEAVVFDVRGYPTDAGARILRHLITAPERDLWMHVPRFVEPFGRIAGWDDHGWSLSPAAPRLGGKVAFLTDGRAISYAESVMGYVEDLGLGAIVGGPTAGTNGNVNSFTVPSGMVVMFTGMRVTRHDGSPFHLAGVRPTIPVEPTVTGIRAGRDEVLERALAHLGR